MASAEASTQSRPQIDVETAARAAREYFRKIYPQINVFSIEEVELTEDDKFWLITLGYEPSNKEKFAAISEFLPAPKTKYKVFKVNASTGRVLSMKIRSLG